MYNFHPCVCKELLYDKGSSINTHLGCKVVQLLHEHYDIWHFLCLKKMENLWLEDIWSGYLYVKSHKFIPEESKIQSESDMQKSLFIPCNWKESHPQKQVYPRPFVQAFPQSHRRSGVQLKNLAPTEMGVAKPKSRVITSRNILCHWCGAGAANLKKIHFAINKLLRPYFHISIQVKQKLQSKDFEEIKYWIFLLKNDRDE